MANLDYSVLPTHRGKGLHVLGLIRLIGIFELSGLLSEVDYKLANMFRATSLGLISATPLYR